MSRWSALWLTIRPSKTGAPAVVLPVVTFATMTAAVLSTAVVAAAFWQVTGESAQVYRVIAAALVTLLVVPLISLAASAARLSARRRDDRLATLRLLGATARWVRRVAVTEATLVAATGVVAGIGLHLATAPLLTFFPIRGGTPDLSDVWLAWWVIAAAALALIAIAVLSAVTGLRRVTISPLGVRARVDAPRLSWVRVAIGGVVVVGAVLLVQIVSGDWGTVGVASAFALAVVSVMAILGVVGPFVVGRLATRRSRRATGAAELIAARGIQESPKAAWRQVSGVALASFLVIPVGSILGYLDAIERSDTVLPEGMAQIFTDVRTVMLAAVVLTFVLVACSIEVTRAAAVIERRELYVSLDRVGMPVAEMTRARRLAVRAPLRVAAFGSAIAAGLLGASFVLTMVVMAPLFMVGAVAALAGGAAIVLLAVRATTPVLRDVLAHPERSV